MDGADQDMKLLAVTVILFRAESVLCQFPFANQNLAGNIPIIGPKLTNKPDIWNKLFVVRMCDFNAFIYHFDIFCQTTVTTTVTSTTAYYCYSTDKLLGALEKIRQCSDSASERRKRAIEVNGIKGVIGKELGTKEIYDNVC